MKTEGLLESSDVYFHFPSERQHLSVGKKMTEGYSHVLQCCSYAHEIVALTSLIEGRIRTLKISPEFQS